MDYIENSHPLLSVGTMEEEDKLFSPMGVHFFKPTKQRSPEKYTYIKQCEQQQKSVHGLPRTIKINKIFLDSQWHIL